MAMAEIVAPSFYVDRDEGLIWCQRCVPAEVIHLAREFRKIRKSGARQDRFMGATTLQASGITCAARCSDCGSVLS